MPIFGAVQQNLFEDLKRKDHVIFNLNAQGYHPSNNVGYSFVNEVALERGMTKFSTIGENDLGTIVSEFDEDEQVWYHGIVNHSIQEGWGDDAYEAQEKALQQIMEKYEDSLVRPMKSLWLARGKIAKLGEEKGNIVRSMAAMANSGADLAIYYL